MNQENNVSLESQPETNSSRSGCLNIGLWVSCLLMTLIGTSAYLVGEWFFEQMVFEGSLGLPDFRPYLTAVWIFASALVFAILYLVGRRTRFGAFYKAGLWALGLGILTLPVKYLALTNWQGSLALIIAALLIFIPVSNGGLKPLADSLKRLRSSRNTGLALVIAAVIWIPWVTLGALGSLLDTVLGMAAAALFAWAAILLARPWLTVTSDVDGPVYGKAARVWCTVILWLLLGAAVAPVGMQPFIPPLAALAALLAIGLSRDPQVEYGLGAAGWMVFASISAPLVWLDGDELMLVVASGTGELYLSAFRMLGITLSLLLFAGSFSLALRDELFQRMAPGFLLKAAPAAAWVLAAALYFITGQPGWYGDRLFVILKDQVDFSQTTLAKTAAEKRAQVYQLTVHQAEQSQAGLTQTFEQWHIEYESFYLENAIEVRGGPVMRAWLEGRDEVDRVLDSPHLRPIHGQPVQIQGMAQPPDRTPWNIRMIHADTVWEQLGVTGAGVIVGQSDSGMQGGHPEIADSYLGQASGDDYTWLDPWFGTSTPTDWTGHGTHTLGTILGNTVGVAPDAEWIGCVNLGRNLGNPALYLTCMQFMLAPYPQAGDAFTDGDPARGANVLNNSWGCPEVEGCDPETFEPALEALRAAGVFVVASAGNSGYAGCGSVDSPLALYGDAFSVGSVDQTGNLSVFSSLGPVLVDGSNRTKPDLLAPGDMILSSYPGSGYEVNSGTSMAGPHLVGVVALMWSANPALIGDVETTTRLLIESAEPYTGTLPECSADLADPQSAIGYGVVDAYQAVLAARQAQP